MRILIVLIPLLFFISCKDDTKIPADKKENVDTKDRSQHLHPTANCEHNPPHYIKKRPLTGSKGEDELTYGIKLLEHNLAEPNTNVYYANGNEFSGNINTSTFLLSNDGENYKSVTMMQQSILGFEKPENIVASDTTFMLLGQHGCGPGLHIDSSEEDNPKLLKTKIKIGDNVGTFIPVGMALHCNQPQNAELPLKPTYFNIEHNETEILNAIKADFLYSGTDSKPQLVNDGTNNFNILSDLKLCKDMDGKECRTFSSHFTKVIKPILQETKEQINISKSNYSVFINKTDDQKYLVLINSPLYNQWKKDPGSVYATPVNFPFVENMNKLKLLINVSPLDLSEENVLEIKSSKFSYLAVFQLGKHGCINQFSTGEILEPYEQFIMELGPYYYNNYPVEFFMYGFHHSDSYNLDLNENGLETFTYVSDKQSDIDSMNNYLNDKNISWLRAEVITWKDESRLIVDKMKLYDTDTSNYITTLPNPL